MVGENYRLHQSLALELRKEIVEEMIVEDLIEDKEILAREVFGCEDLVGQHFRAKMQGPGSAEELLAVNGVAKQVAEISVEPEGSVALHLIIFGGKVHPKK